METLLRKYLWAIDLAVVALCAIFGARATATLIQTRITRMTPAIRSVARAPVASSAGTYYGKQVEEILKRNIFCSTCPPILAPVVDTTSGPPAAPPLQRTSLPLRLLAVMFAPPPGDPRWSVAIIRDVDDKSVGPYTIGSKIRDALISDIDEARVYLEVGGRKEYLDLIDKAPATPTGAPVAAVTAPPADPLMAEMTSPFWSPIFAKGPSGRTLNSRKPAALPSRISGTMRADRDRRLMFPSSESTVWRCTS